MKHSNRTQKKQSSRVLFAIAALVISIAVISCNGVGLFDDYVKISTEEDFQKIRADLTGNFALVNDITLTENFEPIGDPTTPFAGTFEGNSKTIRDLKIIKPGEDDIGFFRAIGAGGEVRNLKLILADGGETVPSIEGASYVGALAGQGAGVISNVGVEGGRLSGFIAGGLVGRMIDGSIIASYATATIQGDGGGLVGNVDISTTGNVTIENSYATGAVIGFSVSTGGLVGNVGIHTTGNVTIENSYATGAVSGPSPTSLGGLAGGGSIQPGVTGNLETINTYFDATLTGQSQGTGIIIDNQGSVTTDITPYYAHTDGQVYKAADGSGGLIQQSDFPDWDFTDYWHWSGDGMWPRLAWQQ